MRLDLFEVFLSSDIDYKPQWSMDVLVAILVDELVYRETWLNQL